MDSKKDKNMDKKLGFRMDDETWTEFTKYCEDNNVSKSEISREAIIKYMSIFNSQNQNPKLIFSYNLFKFMADKISDEDMEKLAILSYENAQNDLKRYSKILKVDFEKMNATLWMGALNNLVFAPEGQNWFANIESSVKKTKIIFAGTHNLGKQFSVFIKYLIIQHFKKYDFEFDKAVLKENKVVIHLKKGNN
ncbi:MAG: hypothetical protein GY870_21400 [archaeon]|nr:hypothetical protein [archaeon]